MKGYTVFNVEQIEGLPRQYHAKAEAPKLEPVARIGRAESFFAATEPRSRMAGARPGMWCRRRGGGVARKEPVGRLEVCPAWALDWRCKSFTGRVGSNREPEATACSMVRRETRDAGAARPCGEEARGEPQNRTQVNS